MILKIENEDKPRTYLADGEFKSEQNEVWRKEVYFKEDKRRAFKLLAKRRLAGAVEGGGKGTREGKADGARARREGVWPTGWSTYWLGTHTTAMSIKIVEAVFVRVSSACLSGRNQTFYVSLPKTFLFFGSKTFKQND